MAGLSSNSSAGSSMQSSIQAMDSDQSNSVEFDLESRRGLTTAQPSAPNATVGSESNFDSSSQVADFGLDEEQAQFIADTMRSISNSGFSMTDPRTFSIILQQLSGFNSPLRMIHRPEDHTTVPVIGKDSVPLGRSPAMPAQSHQQAYITVTQNAQSQGRPQQNFAIQPQRRSQLQQVVPPRPVKPASVVRTARPLPIQEKELAVWDSVALTHSELLEHDAAQYGWSETDTAYVIQYFEQIAMVKGQERVRSIFQQRQYASMWYQYDPLDPLCRFPRKTSLTETIDGATIAVQSKFGVPPVGFVLPDRPDKPRTWIDDFKASDVLFTRTKKWSNQIHGFPNSWEPLPVGTTVVDIIQKYPNHLWDTFLDGILQHRISAGTIWTTLESTKINIPRPANMDAAAAAEIQFPLKNMVELFRAVKISNGSQAENFLTKRLIRRMNVLGSKYSIDKIREYLGRDSAFVVRQLGGELQTGKSTHGDVDHWLKREERAQEARAKLAAEATQPIVIAPGDVSNAIQIDRSRPTTTGDDSDEDNMEDHALLMRTKQLQQSAAKERVLLLIEWSEEELGSIVGRASKIVTRQIADISLLLSRDPHYQSSDNDQTKALATDILRNLIGRHCTTHDSLRPLIRVELAPLDALRKTILAQLTAEAHQLVEQLDIGPAGEANESRMARQVKKMAQGSLSELWMTNYLFICKAIIAMLKCTTNPATKFLMESAPDGELRSYARDTIKAVKATSAGKASPREATYFGADVATLLARDAENRVYLKSGRQLEGLEWIGEMLVEVISHQGDFHEALTGDPELQKLSDDKHFVIAKALQQELRKLKPLSQWKPVMRSDVVGRGEVASDEDEAAAGTMSEPPAKKAKLVHEASTPSTA